MCPQLLLHGKCEKSSKDCAYQHNYLELDLVPTDSKINHLAESIKQKNESLRHSKPPIPWVASSIKDQEKCTLYNSIQTLILIRMTRKWRRRQCYDLNLRELIEAINHQTRKICMAKIWMTLRHQYMKGRDNLNIEIINRN